MAGDNVNPLDEIHPDDTIEQARRDAIGTAQFRAGLGVPHAEVIEWIRSWDTDHDLPRPKPRKIR